MAAAAHGVHRSHDQVDQANSGLSWLLVGLLFCTRAFHAELRWEEDVRSWAAGLLMLGSMWWALGMHRQPRVSHLTFRAGALAGLAWVLEPSTFGLVLALIAVLAKSRTPLLREWAMLLLGLAWLPALAATLHLLGLPLPVAATAAWTTPSTAWLYWTMLVGLLTLAGWLALVGDSQSAGIRRKASRTNATLMLLLTAGLALALYGPSAHALRLAALPIAFAWNALQPPQRQRRRALLWVLAIAASVAGVALTFWG